MSDLINDFIKEHLKEFAGMPWEFRRVQDNGPADVFVNKTSLSSQQTILFEKLLGWRVVRDQLTTAESKLFPVGLDTRDLDESSMETGKNGKKSRAPAWEKNMDKRIEITSSFIVTEEGKSGTPLGEIIAQHTKTLTKNIREDAIKELPWILDRRHSPTLVDRMSKKEPGQKIVVPSLTFKQRKLAQLAYSLELLDVTRHGKDCTYTCADEGLKKEIYETIKTSARTKPSPVHAGR